MVHKSRKSSWKDNIITEDPEQESEEIKSVKRQPNWKKEVKADIIELIEKHDVYDLETMNQEIDHGKWLIEDCLEELKEEDVLEVRN